MLRARLGLYECLCLHEAITLAFGFGKELLDERLLVASFIRADRSVNPSIGASVPFLTTQVSRVGGVGGGRATYELEALIGGSLAAFASGEAPAAEALASLDPPICEAAIAPYPPKTARAMYSLRI